MRILLWMIINRSHSPSAAAVEKETLTYWLTPVCDKLALRGRDLSPHRGDWAKEKDVGLVGVNRGAARVCAGGWPPAPSIAPVNKRQQASERRIKCLRMWSFIYDATLTRRLKCVCVCERQRRALALPSIQQHWVMRGKKAAFSFFHASRWHITGPVDDRVSEQRRHRDAEWRSAQWIQQLFFIKYTIDVEFPAIVQSNVINSNSMS